MRTAMFSALMVAAGASNPAFAQNDAPVVFASGTGEFDDRHRAHDTHDIAVKISNPDMQDTVADTVERVAAAMLFVPVGPMAEAIEKARPGTVDRSIGYDTRLGDLAGRDAATLPRRLGERSRDAMGMATGIAQTVATMMPEFERMGRELAATITAAETTRED